MYSVYVFFSTSTVWSVFVGIWLTAASLCVQSAAEGCRPCWRSPAWSAWSPPRPRCGASLPPVICTIITRDKLRTMERKNWEVGWWVFIGGESNRRRWQREWKRKASGGRNDEGMAEVEANTGTVTCTVTTPGHKTVTQRGEIWTVEVLNKT